MLLAPDATTLNGVTPVPHIDDPDGTSSVVVVVGSLVVSVSVVVLVVVVFELREMGRVVSSGRSPQPRPKSADTKPREVKNERLVVREMR